MSGTNTSRAPLATLFSYGFRVFFLLAMLFAPLAIIVWMTVIAGDLVLTGPFSPVDWHVHEILFGYTSAVMAGFLFTAIPNWTGRKPVQGATLVVLALIWISGRVLVAGVGGFGTAVVAVADNAFMIAVALLALREIIAGKNWRNLMVVGPIGVFVVANILFHIEAATQGAADSGKRLGFAAVVFLIMLIGGRIVPAFTGNWLSKSGPGPLPTPFNRYDGVCILAAAVGLLSWSVWPDHGLTRSLLALAAALHFVRMLRWQGHHTLRSALLLMLHVSYGFIPVGLMALAAGNNIAGFHLLGIGAIAGMTLAVMIRASLGHTGQQLAAGPVLSTAFCSLILAAIVRAVLPDTPAGTLTGLWLAAAFWVLAFTTVLVRIGPLYFRAKH